MSETSKGPRCVRLKAVDAGLVPDTRPEEDAEQLAGALVTLVRRAMEESGRSQASVAEEIHVSVKHLNRMLQGHSQLTLWWAARILRVCGMRLVIGEDGR